MGLIDQKVWCGGGNDDEIHVSDQHQTCPTVTDRSKEGVLEG